MVHLGIGFWIFSHCNIFFLLNCLFSIGFLKPGGLVKVLQPFNVLVKIWTCFCRPMPKLWTCIPIVNLNYSYWVIFMPCNYSALKLVNWRWRARGLKLSPILKLGKCSATFGISRLPRTELGNYYWDRRSLCQKIFEFFFNNIVVLILKRPKKCRIFRNSQ